MKTLFVLAAAATLAAVPALAQAGKASSGKSTSSSLNDGPTLAKPSADRTYAAPANTVTIPNKPSRWYPPRDTRPNNPNGGGGTRG